jgi:hypothetical protein
MAGLQPHVLVLSLIKRVFEGLKKDPDLIHFILSGYDQDEAISNIYGEKFISNAVEYLRTVNIHYVLGYRIDTAKLPNICVTCEGGTESTQFIGDFGRIESVALPPTKYGTFHISSLDADGNPLVSTEFNPGSILWTGVQITDKTSKIKRTVRGLIQAPGAQEVSVILDKPLKLENGLDSWTSISPNKQRIRTIGSSLDQVTVKIYMDVAGDPELCDVMNSVMRHAIKQSRLLLASYGFNTPTSKYSQIARNTSYAGENVWTAEFSISGAFTDEWVLADAESIDTIKINFECMNDRSSFL